MIAVIQRVSSASVTVESEKISAIGPGLLILLGVVKGDTEKEIDYLVDKIANFRIFSNHEGKFDLSLLDTGGEALVVSQFTLAGSWRKGRRPGFDNAAHPSVAEPLYETFCEKLATAGVPVKRGLFGAMMGVELVNDGPVTFVLDTDS